MRHYDSTTDRKLDRVETIVTVVVLAISVTIAMLPLLRVHEGYYPGGIDAMGFLAKIEKVALNWSEGNFSDWFPWWYNGASITQYYPPLSVWIPAAIQMATNDIFATFKIVCWVCLVSGGCATAFFGRRLGLSGYSAAASGVLYATGTYTLYTVLGDGTIGRALSLPLFPLLLGALFELGERRSPCAWTKTALLVFALILAHAMHAYLIFICAGAAVLVFATRWRDWLSRIGTIATACVSGVLLTGFWSAPGYLPLDIPGVPAAGVGWEVYWTASIRSLAESDVVGSITLFGLALVGVMVSWKMDRLLGVTMAVSAILAITLIYGPANPLYRLLPLNSSLAPVRFLNAAYLPCAILGGIALDFSVSRNSSARMRLLSFLLLLVVSGLSLWEQAYRKPVSSPMTYAEVQHGASLFGRAPDAFELGRLVVEATSLNSEQAYFAIDQGHNASNGWNIEGTPHANAYRSFNQCYGFGFDEYVVSTWSLWNVGGVIVDGRSPRLVSLLEERGWRLIDTNSGLSVLRASETPGYFQEMVSNVLVIGRSNLYVRRLLPAVAEGPDANPLEYSDEYLDLFDVLYLYDLPTVDRDDLEQWIMKWVRQGKKIIVDLSSTQLSTLLGVGCSQRTISGLISLSGSVDSPFSNSVVGLSEGSGAVYSGLDRVWMTTTVENQETVVCGVKETQYGDVTFIGLHIPRLSQIKSKQEAADLLARIIGPQYCTRIEQGIPFSVTAQWDSRGVSFEYTAGRETPVVVSITHTERWHATIDGAAAPLFRHESLVLMVLPGGQHSVRLTYGHSPAVFLGWSVSLLGVCVSGVCLIWLRRVEHCGVRKEESA